MAFKDLRERRAYFRDYYQKHKEEQKKQSRAQYQAHREERLKRSKAHYHEDGGLEKQRAYVTSHRSKYAEYQRNSNYRVKKEVLKHYSIGVYPICAHCGEEDIDVLCLDHVDNNGAEHRRAITRAKRAGHVVYWWLKRNDYPEGFQVLCANCNLKKEILRRRNMNKAKEIKMGVT